MKFKIEKEVFKNFPNLFVLIPIVYGFDNLKSNQEALSFLRVTEKEVRNKLDINEATSDARIAEYLKAFRKFGVGPEIKLPAHWALIKRVLEGSEIPDINPMVNLYNAMSIKYMTPFGGEDLETVFGDFELKFAKGNERWVAIGATKSKGPQAGELVWGDDLDLSTKALNWRQCERTKLTNNSKNGYFIMDGFENINKKNILAAADEFSEMVIKLLGGKVEIVSLDKDVFEAEIDFVSKKISDFKPVQIKTKITIKKDLTKIENDLFNVLCNITGEKEINIEHPSDEKFGDYSTNIAMILAKKEKNNPRVVAEEIVKKLENNSLFEKVEVAGPGFINMTINKNLLLDEAIDLNFDNVLMEKLSLHGKGKTMVIDYSAPNIAKPFGIGHLRSTNIGQAIYNIYKTLGWNCIGDNHLGDWGTQFGKLIVAIKKFNDKKVEDLSIQDLEKLYVKFHSEEEKDPTLEDQGREAFAKLEKGDEETVMLWQTCIDISIKEFNKVYDMLGVKIDYALGESFYLDKMEVVLKMMEDKRILKDSQGAKIVEFPKMPIAIVTKSNGTTTYLLRDLATIKYRMETWNPDLIVYEVGADQELYFRQVFATAQMLGWNPQLYHVAHGMFRFTDGKFSTRKGKTIHLSDVIEKAREEAKKIAPDNEPDKIEKVAIGAVKFNDLSQDPKKDIVFDWEKVMSMDGDSGPYLQYTYARCLSVLAKSKLKEQKDIESVPSNSNDSEISLLRELTKLEEKLLESANRFSPAVLAEYLLGIARKYNEFYAKNRIISSEEEVWRIFLTKTTANVIHRGLSILGIETIEKM